MRTIKNIINLFFLLLGHIFIRTKNKIVFGAWEGCSYSDNPKFLFEYFFNHPEWQIVWIGNKHVKNTLPQLPKHAKFATRHSILGLWHALTASTWVFTHCTNDIALVAIWGRACLIDPWHGVALKSLGGDKSPYAVKCSQKKPTMLTRFWSTVFRNKTNFGTPSSFQGKNLKVEIPNLVTGDILPFGSPSFDFLINNKHNTNLITSLRRKLSRIFNIPLNKQWIVYAPTFRITRKTYNKSFCELDSDYRKRLLSFLQKSNAVIVEKLHPILISGAKATNDGFIFSISGEDAKKLDMYELWLAADMLISDYSSVTAAFYVQNKPVIHYVYDYEYYTTKDSGLVFDLEQIKFGPIARTLDELLILLEGPSSALYVEGVRTKSLLEYEKGTACEQYLDFISSHV